MLSLLEERRDVSSPRRASVCSDGRRTENLPGWPASGRHRPGVGTGVALATRYPAGWSRRGGGDWSAGAPVVPQEVHRRRGDRRAAADRARGRLCCRPPARSIGSGRNGPAGEDAARRPSRTVCLEARYAQGQRSAGWSGEATARHRSPGSSSPAWRHPPPGSCATIRSAGSDPATDAAFAFTGGAVVLVAGGPYPAADLSRSAQFPLNPQHLRESTNSVDTFPSLLVS